MGFYPFFTWDFVLWDFVHGDIVLWYFVLWYVVYGDFVRIPDRVNLNVQMKNPPVKIKRTVSLTIISLFIVPVDCKMEEKPIHSLRNRRNFPKLTCQSSAMH